MIYSSRLFAVSLSALLFLCAALFPFRAQADVRALAVSIAGAPAAPAQDIRELPATPIET